MQENQPQRLLRNADLVRRYNRSQRSVDRYKKAGVIPPPDVEINGISYWYEETIERNERERLAPEVKSVA